MKLFATDTKLTSKNLLFNNLEVCQLDVYTKTFSKARNDFKCENFCASEKSRALHNKIEDVGRLIIVYSGLGETMQSWG